MQKLPRSSSPHVFEPDLTLCNAPTCSQCSPSPGIWHQAEEEVGQLKTSFANEVPKTCIRVDCVATNVSMVTNYFNWSDSEQIVIDYRRKIQDKMIDEQ